MDDMAARHRNAQARVRVNCTMVVDSEAYEKRHGRKPDAKKLTDHVRDRMWEHMGLLPEVLDGIVTLEVKAK